MPPLLLRGHQVQAALEQPPQQLPAPHVQLVFQLTVLQPRRLLRRHPVLKLTEALPWLRERLVAGRHVPLHRAPSFAIRSSDNRIAKEGALYARTDTTKPDTPPPSGLNRFTLHHLRRAAPIADSADDALIPLTRNPPTVEWRDISDT
jgi:hypothetical protein